MNKSTMLAVKFDQICAKIERDNPGIFLDLDSASKKVHAPMVPYHRTKKGRAEALQNKTNTTSPPLLERSNLLEVGNLNLNPFKEGRGEGRGVYPDGNPAELVTTGEISRTVDSKSDPITLGISTLDEDTFWVDFRIKKRLICDVTEKVIRQHFPKITDEAYTIIYHLLVSFNAELNLNEIHKKSFKIFNAVSRDNKNYCDIWAKRKNVTDWIVKAEDDGWIEISGGHTGRCTRLRATGALVRVMIDVTRDIKTQLKEKFIKETTKMKKYQIATKTMEGKEVEVKTRSNHPTTGKYHRTTTIIPSWISLASSSSISLSLNPFKEGRGEGGGVYPDGNTGELVSTGVSSRTVDFSDEVKREVQEDYFQGIFGEDLILKSEEIWMQRKFIEGKNQKGQKSATEGGGRYYHPLISMPRAMRATLRIDGTPTVQYDYSDAQMRLLYARGGYGPPADLKSEIHKDKKVAKQIMVYLIGAKTKKAINLGSINNNLKENNMWPISQEEWEQVQDTLSPVWDYFGESAYMWTQQEESEVATDIISMGIEEGILVIPYHDGFICSKKHEEWLIMAMVKSWYDHTGDKAAIKKEH